MRLFKLSIDGAKKRRLLFGSNIDETKLILAILRQSARTFPKLPSTQTEYNRLRNIIKYMGKALREIEE